MAGFGDRFIRLRRWIRRRKDTRAGARPTHEGEAAVPTQPTASPDDDQMHGESVEQRPEQVVRQPVDRLEGQPNNISNLQAEAEMAWARAVRLESEYRARQRYRAELETARRWRYGARSVVLPPFLNNNNNNDSAGANGTGNENLLFASNVLRTDHDARPPTRGQWPQELRSTDDDLENNSLPTPAMIQPTPAVIQEHIMQVFNSLSPEEQPAMTAWIVMMAATQVARDLARMESAGG